MTEATMGVLLAGGLATRMGGGDKPLRLIAGRPILDHVIARLAPQCAGLVLNANGDPSRFAGYDLPVVADDVPGFAGPLAGILAGLEHAASQGVGHVVSVAADTPFIPTDLVARLHAARAAEGAVLAVAASGGWSHPVIGLWPVSIRAALRAALVEEGLRKIDLFTARYPLATVEWPMQPHDPFFNANRPEDLAEAEAIAKANIEGRFGSE
jgi:molybdopterin-guanine dinucleotide biosynthesis protein A